MRALLLPALLCLAACGGPPPAPQPRTDDANAIVSGESVSGGCGGSSSNATGNGSDNLSLAVAACVPELTPAERAPLEARARRGDVAAMLDLAMGTENMPDKRRWYAAAAARGNCQAISQLTETYEGSVGSGLSPAERRHWAAEDRRIGCGVQRWTREGAALVYGEPQNPYFMLSIGCAGGRVRIATFLGAAAPGPQTFRTSRGEQPRMMRPTNDTGPVTYDAAPDDEVLAALLRGERVEMDTCMGCGAVMVDASAVRSLLPALVRQCTGNAG